MQSRMFHRSGRRRIVQEVVFGMDFLHHNGVSNMQHNASAKQLLITDSITSSAKYCVFPRKAKGGIEKGFYNQA
jgi:hypothetical protein